MLAGPFGGYLSTLEPAPEFVIIFDGFTCIRNLTATAQMKRPSVAISTGEDRFSDFIDAAAHDLHAPLRKLSVLVDRVFTKYSSDFDDEAREYVSRIEKCIVDMRSLIDALEELSRSGNDVLTAMPCDLASLVKQSLEDVDGAGDHGVEMVISPLPTVYGQPALYRQLFKNLFENAIKFRRQDVPLKIQVISTRLPDTDAATFDLPARGGYYQIEVTDNGMGFHPSSASKIFEPFVRLNPKSKFQGNGLGLTICRKIITAHGGSIYAEPNEGHGSRFVLILPEIP